MNEKISVITTVFNCQNYLAQSLQSIRIQTFQDFKHILVNDGSTDNTAGVIQKIAGDNPKLVIFNNQSNLGRVKSLNIALKMAKGKYVALHDADDISLPHRLEKQYKFLEENSDYVLVGSDIDVIDESEKIISQPVRPQKNLDAKFSLLFRCTFANPSIVFRKKILDENGIRYEENYEHSEDFKLISLLSQHGKVYNMQEKLVKYRKHNDNYSNRHFHTVNDESTSVAKENIERLGIHISIEQTNRLRKLISSRAAVSDHLFEDVRKIFQIIRKFQINNPSKKNNEVLRTLRRMMRWLGRKNILSNPKYFALYISILTYYKKQSIFVGKVSEDS